MSYSRFSDSCWYTFWLFKGHESRKQDETLAVHYGRGGYKYLTYKELKRDREDLMFNLAIEFGAGPDEIDLLDIYIDNFLSEVDDEYSK